jgi:hypothetical protein
METPVSGKQQVFTVIRERLSILLFIASLLVCFLTLIRAGLTLSHGYRTEFISGAWISLAQDVLSGTFYRPLFSPELGYGGTRYFPVFFLALGLCMSVFRDPVVAGLVLTLLSAVLFVCGGWRMCRHFGLSRPLSFALAAFPMATLAVQSCVDTLRCDLLSAAFSIWGVSAFLRWQSGKSTPWPAMAFFLLAFMTKMTAVYAAAAAIMYLLFNRRREAGVFMGAMAAGVAAFGLIICLASGWRVAEIFSTCSDGGINAISILKGPWTAANTLLNADHFSFALSLLAAGAALLLGRSANRSFAVLCFLSSLCVVSLVFASPGVHINHFVDLSAASILLLGPVVRRQEDSQGNFIIACMLLLAVLSSGVILRETLVYDVKRRTFDDARAVADLVGHDGDPIVSEDPLVPILLRERVIAPEPFMMRIVASKSPALAEQIGNQIRLRRFRAIILLRDPEVNAEWYSTMHFGAPFVAAVKEHYPIVRRVGDFFVYLPPAR